MKAKLPFRLSAAEKKALDEEIRKQCVDVTGQYELDLDTVAIYILHTVFGFGEKRLTRFYSAMFAKRKEIQAYYQGERHDNTAEVAMRHRLQQDGIDVKKMYERETDNRFIVTLSDKGDKHDI